VPATAVLAARTARLWWNARRVRRGLPARYGAGFLEPLGRAEALVLVPNGRLRRERWAERATAMAARALGLRVTLR
jgi:hypothetical protein